MNKLLVLGCIVLFLTMSASVNAQVLSPVVHMKGELDQDSMAFFVGKTDISGDFQGYPMDSVYQTDSMINISSFEDILNNYSVEVDFNLSLLEDLHAFPLLNSCTFKDVSKVTIVDIQELQSLDFESMSPEDLIDFINGIKSFSNVDIIAKEGPFIFGTDGSGITTQSVADYALSSVVSFEIEEGNNLPFLVMLTKSQMSMQYSGESSLLFQFSEGSGSIIVRNSDGGKLWNGDLEGKVFFIEDDNLSFIQNSSLYTFPLSSEEKQFTVTLSISPAESDDANIATIFEEIPDVSDGLGNISIPGFSNNTQGFDEIISVASSIINGGMVLIKTNDSFTVDDSLQAFSRFGFARGDKFDITISGNQTVQTEITGDYKLIFLGDHFYNPQAKESEDGIAFPILLVVVWILAIGLYVLFRFYLKKEVNEEIDTKLKRYALIFHVIALIVTFILVDREISFQFGSSAIDALLGQGLSLIVLAFIGLELGLWGLGFLALGLPIRIIVNSGLRLVGIGKGGKGIGKGIGALFIWVFCAVYAVLILNIIFMILIHPGIGFFR